MANLRTDIAAISRHHNTTCILRHDNYNLCALILTGLQCFINHLLTFLLTGHFLGLYELLSGPTNGDHQSSVSTGQMPFLMPNRQHRNT